MKQKIILSIVLTLSLFSMSCIENTPDTTEKEHPVVSETPERTKPTENYNISIFLDLSDRIDPIKHANKTMDYYQRDIRYIKAISEAFTDHASKRKINQVNDKLQLFFDPEPKNTKINAISEKLKIKLDRNNISKEKLNEIRKIYANYPIQIYELAIKDKAYVGSDIWGFFKNKVADYCIEENSRNILIILTDGYIFNKGSELKNGNRTNYLLSKTIRNNKLNDAMWKEKMDAGNFGFIKAANNLSNLEVLVLGINPDTKNTNEEAVIIEYWEKWLKEMKVSNPKVRGAELPSNMEKIIKDFIDQKK
ncbi:hypothetical protein [Flavobacterium sp.]|uniref:hypothetical protein n=1 Tax=Flavobacterium sp. TaxID=239 RepID=UPI00261637A8|nr:hypothetical protein [Flavobacterium sp.]